MFHTPWVYIKIISKIGVDGHSQMVYIELRTTCFTATVAGLRNECPVGMSFLNLLRED